MCIRDRSRGAAFVPLLDDLIVQVLRHGVDDLGIVGACLGDGILAAVHLEGADGVCLLYTSR